jgi:hypothetical protein
MSKLSKESKFLDLSDYGRPIAKFLVAYLKKTALTPIHLTLIFGISGLVAVYSIFTSHYFIAGVFLIIKSIIDAMDGELARAKNTPSFTGRYLDSLFDIIINFLILFTIGFVTQTPAYLTFLAFVCVQLQGTLFNFYYVILRNNTEGGDTTSQIFETKEPISFPNERQETVKIMYNLYQFFYGAFDRIIYALDKNAPNQMIFPSWFMTLLSLYGLGFQLLLIAVLLSLGLVNYCIPFFIFYSILGIFIVGIRKIYLNE